MMVVAVVSTAAEEVCMEPVLVNQLGFAYTTYSILNPHWNCVLVDPRLTVYL